MQRFSGLTAAHFAGIADTCLNIAREVEAGIAYSNEYKRPAVGGLVWDGVIALLTAAEIDHNSGSSAFITGRANVAVPIIRRLERQHPELGITTLMRHAYALHSLEHAGQMRRGSYTDACQGAERLLTALNSLLPAEARIESQRFAWLADLSRA